MLVGAAPLTPSFSLCMRIFLSATIAPERRERALWTSLSVISASCREVRRGCNVPKCSLSKLAHDLIFADIGAAVKLAMGEARSGSGTRRLRHCGRAQDE